MKCVVEGSINLRTYCAYTRSLSSRWWVLCDPTSGTKRIWDGRTNEVSPKITDTRQPSSFGLGNSKKCLSSTNITTTWQLVANAEKNTRSAVRATQLRLGCLRLTARYVEATVVSCLFWDKRTTAQAGKWTLPICVCQAFLYKILLFSLMPYRIQKFSMI